ncbi:MULTISPECIES: ammonium transporter [unclassified Mucilaginibacter]|uniref:ammonium transporter n=1 Tax=unclassified Mucilaginibacter TaxID=2617802 RepID=UPI002AC94CCF|nr:MULTISPECIES: ammonium transporter [unclassified Mucilaginibacter]MEB0261491.1 ammonium transporter [Mucilaginibacter sp. 10I4]MEB0276923.1 ammonium transporter [Mucilaginibacter sp. 10B2]MEB0300757.1 ammonium transporter [Mucilaginibacter sp. 5C4]WPX25023.1 ammonium transporter [Mucilaginibacter sp. 5C4]
MKRYFPFFVILVILSLTFIFPSVEYDKTVKSNFNTGDIAWMLMSTALVLIMTPGLAFFYGGMVNKKNVISTMLQSIVCMVIITVLWGIFGFSLAFGDSIGGVIGNPSTFFMMKGMLGNASWKAAPTIPLLLFAMYQLKFAIITPALITGAFAERIRFNSYIIFLVLFSIFIFSPLAHATWHPDGVLAKLGVLDFAGGTVVHMSAGWAALASALFLKRRNEANHAPARITYVMIGTGLLWFGWFGFNAGSAFGANHLAVTALATSTTASAAAGVTWIFFDMLRGRKPSAMGTCIGAVVGLVAITPAAGFVSVPHSLAIGIISAVVSNLVVEWRTRTTIDDTLDVFPCHGVGGMVGMLLTGVFANHNVNPANVTGDGLFFGHTHLFFIQLFALVATSIFSFFGSVILLKVTDMISPLRVSKEDEVLGLDISQHGEKL